MVPSFQFHQRFPSTTPFLWILIIYVLSKILIFSHCLTSFLNKLTKRTILWELTWKYCRPKCVILEQNNSGIRNNLFARFMMLSLVENKAWNRKELNTLLRYLRTVWLWKQDFFFYKFRPVYLIKLFKLYNIRHVLCDLQCGTTIRMKHRQKHLWRSVTFIEFGNRQDFLPISNLVGSNSIV